MRVKDVLEDAGIAPGAIEVIGEIPIVLRTSAVESISLSGPLLSVGQYLFELVSDDGLTFDSEELLVTGQEDG